MLVLIAAIAFLSMPLLTLPQIQIINTYSVIADDFKVDKLGNIYFIKGNKIVKHTKNFEKISEYRNTLLGNPHSIDVSNPFRILVYYKDFNQIVYLDSELAELKSPISLDELGFFDVTAVCYSLNGGFWVYRNQVNRALQISTQLQKTQESPTLSVREKDGEALSIMETSNNIFILFESNYVYILNNLGAYYKKIFIDEAIDVIPVKNVLMYVNKNELILKNIHNYQEKSYSLNIDKIKALDSFGNKIFILTDKSLITFSIEL